MATTSLQPPASLDALSQSIHDHVMAFYDRRLALKTPLDSPDVEDILACAITLEKIVRSGKRYVKKARVAITPWMQTVVFNAPDTGTKDMSALLQRVTVMQAYSTLEQLSTALIEWQGLAVTYRQWADPLSQQYHAVLKRQGSSSHAPEPSQELPQGSPKAQESPQKLPPADPPTQGPNSHDLLHQLENALDRHANVLAEEIDTLHHRIKSYHARYRHGHVLDFQMAGPALGCVHSLRGILAIKKDSLREARQSYLTRKSQNAQQKTASRPPAPVRRAKKLSELPPEWSIVKP